MKHPRLPRIRHYNWMLFWREYRFTIALFTLQFLAFCVLGYLFWPKDVVIHVGQPQYETPLAEKIAAHDAEFEKAMLEVIARDEELDKGRTKDVAKYRKLGGDN